MKRASKKASLKKKAAKKKKRAAKHKVLRAASPWLPVDEAAIYCGYAPRSFDDFRFKGGGPLYSKRGGKILYHQTKHLDVWMDDGERESTAA